MENQETEQHEPRYFSPETRAKLSEAMKRRWALKREQEAHQEERVAAGEQLGKLYSAARELVDDEQAKALIVENISTQQLVAGIKATANMFGTKSTERLTSAFQKLIVEAIGLTYEATE
jgi:hypothetical protein